MARGWGRVAVLVVGFVLAVAMGAQLAAAAPPFAVNSTLDEHDAFTDGLCVSAPSGVCTLRAAVEEINNLSGSGNINVAAGTYTLTLGDLDITSGPTISGARSAITAAPAPVGSAPPGGA